MGADVVPMSPAEDERSSILPTLSWNSIVDDRSSDGQADVTPDASVPASPVDWNAAPPDAPAIAMPQISMSLRLDGPATPVPAPPAPPSAMMPPAPPVPPAPPTAPPAPPAASPVALLSVTPAIGGVDPIAVEPSADATAMASEAANVPDDSVSDRSPFTLTMSPLVIADDEPASSYTPIEPVGEFVLPSIREATPVEPYDPAVVDEGSADQIAPIALSDSPMVLTTTTVPVVSGSVASVAAPGAIVLPTIGQPAQAARPVPSVSPLAVEMPQRRTPAKRRRRTGLRLVLVLVLLVAIVAGAIVFGRPYLFPDEWAANAKPYAVAVQDVTGAEFAEPLMVTAEPAADHQSRATSQLAGDWQSQVPVWRALGLASGEVTEAGLDELLAGWAPALYSTDDGQIYHDESVTGASLEALITRSMASAQLDQQFGWAIGQSARTLDDAALTSAGVLAQATTVQRATPFDTPIETAPTAPLAYLPAVISYQVLAPAMYAPLLAPVDPAGTNPLAELSTAGPGPLSPDAPVLAAAPEMRDGDVIVASPVAMDRSFWYLTFASYLDAPTAFAASEAVVENALTVAQRSGTTCAYATFSGGDLIQTAALRSALESWVATVPAEFTSAFSVADDGDLQLESCDPGGQFVGANRIGTARELIGWRSAEIATINGVVAAGGGEAEIAAALIRLAQSDVGAQVAASPVGDTPTQAAEATSAAVAVIVSPPAPPAPEPGG